ncbi:MAG: hypothetical protein M1611_00145 [Candidatus Marsarchaeota archaeon]|nr:hypothetical protein [Candidatus Marsarchaeota archaeon]
MPHNFPAASFPQPKRYICHDGQIKLKAFPSYSNTNEICDKMAKQKDAALRLSSGWVFGFEFLASLFFFYAIMTATGVGATFPWANGSVWQPLLYAAAVTGSVLLLFTSIATFNRQNERGTRLAFLSNVVAGFSLFALTAGTSVYFGISLIGFILGFIGSAWSYLE